ncbi:hypothetical protein MYX07_03920 [Patescibacteria group bacterium AH-259-L07]|nr:hypothetical protein [Patescibacteria group bacterium AH-259-L07]
MHDFFLSLPSNLNICLTSKRDFLSDNDVRFLAQAYLPGLNFLRSKPDKISITVKYIESAARHMVRRGNHITIYGHWRGESSILDIFHLLYSTARINWLSRGLYPIHATCVGINNYTLIVGHSGVGKTSITLQMVNKYRTKIFSGNKTLVSFKRDGTINAVAGTKIMTMNTADFNRYMPTVEHMVHYQNRKAFLLEKNKYASESSVKIKSIVIVRINDGVEECSKLNPERALHMLYPYFLDRVNADTIVCDGKDVFVGTPPEGTQRQLVSLLSRSLPHISVYTVNGSVSFIANTIKNL